jgi:hypothetical protein
MPILVIRGLKLKHFKTRIYAPPQHINNARLKSEIESVLCPFNQTIDARFEIESALRRLRE